MSHPASRLLPTRRPTLVPPPRATTPVNQRQARQRHIESLHPQPQMWPQAAWLDRPRWPRPRTSRAGLLSAFPAHKPWRPDSLRASQKPATPATLRRQKMLVRSSSHLRSQPLGGKGERPSQAQSGLRSAAAHLVSLVQLAGGRRASLPRARRWTSTEVQLPPRQSCPSDREQRRAWTPEQSPVMPTARTKTCPGKDPLLRFVPESVMLERATAWTWKKAGWTPCDCLPSRKRAAEHSPQPTCSGLPTSCVGPACRSRRGSWQRLCRPRPRPARLLSWTLSRLRGFLPASALWRAQQQLRTRRGRSQARRGRSPHDGLARGRQPFSGSKSAGASLRPAVATPTLPQHASWPVGSWQLWATRATPAAPLHGAAKFAPWRSWTLWLDALAASRLPQTRERSRRLHNRKQRPRQRLHLRWQSRATRLPGLQTRPAAALPRLLAQCSGPPTMTSSFLGWPRPQGI